MSTRQVIIAQSSMITGGRLHVVFGIVACLNSLGIVPDVLTYRHKFDPEQAMAQYNAHIRVQFRKLPNYVLLPADLNTARFNLNLRRVSAECDLLINNSNSLIFLPDRVNVLTYMYFPRKSRIDSGPANIHDPGGIRISPWSWSGLYNRGLRTLYRFSQPIPDHGVVCISDFTRKALIEAYPKLGETLPVIPPPVRLREFENTGRERMPWVTSVGRFDAYKGQLRQIELAAQFPELTFHIVGFIADRNYFEQCKSYLRQHRIGNVELHPQAGHEEMVSLLKRSRYFLHTTINEPFGITAVQAIAAGCVPLCHDSGGQRETVCIDSLRYQNLAQAADIMRELQRQPESYLTALVEELQAHIQQYDERVFGEKMTTILEERLRL